ITEDERIVLASEVGAIDLPARSIVSKGRLKPGRMLLVDTEAGRIISDDEVKADVASRFPYRRWLESNQFRIEDLPEMPSRPPVTHAELDATQRAFGYTAEDVDRIISVMAG